MKEILMQQTIDWLYPINPQLLDNITKGRAFDKETIRRKRHNILYFKR